MITSYFYDKTIMTKNVILSQALGAKKRLNGMKTNNLNLKPLFFQRFTFFLVNHMLTGNTAVCVVDNSE